MEENMIGVRETKTFYFYFDWPKNVTKIRVNDFK